MIIQPGHTAIIMGAGSGIGAALARALATRGVRVLAADKNAGAVQGVVDSIDQGDAIAAEVDVSDLASVRALGEVATEHFDSAPRLLFNNAGIMHSKPLVECSREEFDRLVSINLGGIFNGLNVFLPGMLAAGEPGHIVNTSSLSGILYYGNLGLYTASKFGVLGLSLCLAEELEGTNLGLSVLMPGGVDTNIVSSIKDIEPEKLYANLAPVTKAAEESGSEIISPELVAEVVLNAIAKKQRLILSHRGYLKQAEQQLNDVLQAMRDAPYV